MKFGEGADNACELVPILASDHCTPPAISKHQGWQILPIIEDEIRDESGNSRERDSCTCESSQMEGVGRMEQLKGFHGPAQGMQD